MLSKRTHRKFKKDSVMQHHSTRSEKHFSSDYDDSSDEETSTENVNTYDVNLAWASFKKAMPGYTGPDDLLSFVVHAAGLQLLYSTQVNTQYYALKHTILHEDQALERIKGIFYEGAKKAITESLQKLLEFIDYAPETLETKKQVRENLTCLERKILDIVEQQLALHLEVLIELIKSNRFAQSALFNTKLNSFVEVIIASLVSSVNSVFNKIEKGPDRNLLKKKLYKLARNNFLSLLSDAMPHDLQHLSGQKKALEFLSEYEGFYPHSNQLLKTIIRTAHAKGYVKTMVQHYLDDPANHNVLMIAYLKDVRNIFHLHPKSHAVLSEAKALIKEYDSINRQNLSDEIFTHLSEKLTSQWQCVVNFFYRPVLPKSYTFSSNNPYSFFANLRLSNRSQKRRSLNIQHALFQKDCVARFWRLSPQASSHADVIELQSILAGSFGRLDVISELGSYEKVAENIEQIKAFYAAKQIFIEDKDIAQWIRTIFKGSEPNLGVSDGEQLILLNKLQALTYLLFGCESTRNPAMSIVNQMLLDLILKKDYHFASILLTESTDEPSSQTMPMATKGAVSIARVLESRYRSFMPHAYHYQGIEESDSHTPLRLSQFVAAEAAIVKAWLNVFSGETVTQTSLQKEKATTILNRIEAHFSNWFQSEPVRSQVADPYSLRPSIR
ncbi:MAG: hypothetical protein H0W64_12545 [Gammaproteobacteria bacterium]|nr:hypothetical protein [Gammaproteobacteria bacterium]